MAGREARAIQRSLAEPWAREQRALRRQWTRLAKKHKGEYVAIYRGRLVGYAPDDEELARRLFRRLGDVPFYIAKISDEATVYDLPGPEGVE